MALDLNTIRLKAGNGVQLTKELFYEWNNIDAPYTLKPEDFTSEKGNTYASFSKIYLEQADEYEAALALVGTWAHWEKLCKSKWFMEGKDGNYRGLNDWREEMRLRDESSTKRILQKLAKQGNVTAARYLNETAKKTDTKGKGRPEKKAPAKMPSNAVNLAKEIARRKQG